MNYKKCEVSQINKGKINVNNKTSNGFKFPLISQRKTPEHCFFGYNHVQN